MNFRNWDKYPEQYCLLGGYTCTYEKGQPPIEKELCKGNFHILIVIGPKDAPTHYVITGEVCPSPPTEEGHSLWFEPRRLYPFTLTVEEFEQMNWVKERCPDLFFQNPGFSLERLKTAILQFSGLLPGTHPIYYNLTFDPVNLEPVSKTEVINEPAN